MAIRPNDRRRLARLAMPLVYARRDEVNRRMELRASLRCSEHVHALLLLEGIDPESTCVMRRLREVEAKLAAIPDTPELEEADEAYLARADTGWIDEEWRRGRRYRPPPREEKTFASEVERLIGRFRSDIREIDSVQASPIELYAWCLSKHGASFDEATENVAEAAQDLLLLVEGLPEDATPEDIERALLGEENQ
jgi:hypothetical protein